jgi:hypothetical protein
MRRRTRLIGQPVVCLFAQIQRILKINDLNTITREVVETARETLLIGAE